MILISQRRLWSMMASYGLTYSTLVIFFVEYRKLLKKYKKLHGVSTYMAHLIEEHEVPINEFDLIALNDLGVKFSPKEEHNA